MEGIAGTYGYSDKTIVQRMLRKVRHRGPDGTMYYVDDRVALGAEELALSAGEKVRPVVEDDGLAVASDSYLFNRLELKEEFAPGLEWDQFTDAEVVLEMYRALGTKAFNYMDGAFAVALVDDGRLVLARDRYGLKPMFMSGGIRKGTFSSEMKSQLVASADFVEFPPGKVLLQGKGYFAIRPSRPPRRRLEPPRGPDRELRELLIDSVERVADNLPSLNILLSGGIDSSAIAAAAAQVAPQLKTVCVGIPGGVDLDMSRKVAEALGTDHTERIYTVDDMLEVLDEAIYSMESFDYPLIRSCIPNYIATHAFEGPHRVLLCGEGGDEIFAGYDYMRDIGSDRALAAERKKLLRTGHTTGFARVDRMTASASQDGRMPLMDGRIIDLGLSLGWKHLGRSPSRCKLALRKAFEDVLPREVMRRRKQRFSDGAGSIDSLVKVSEQLISDAEFEKGRKALPKGRIRTKEELIYYRIFEKHFPSRSAAAAVGFTPRP